MYEYIIGKVVSIKEDYIVLDNNGIGYRIYTSKNSLMNLEIHEKITMYIYFNLREDGVYLYGFITEEELNMFNLLLLVSKVGPKVGLNILSTLTPNQIKLAILKNDSNILCNAPGVGKKTASRIILELKDRVDKEDIVEDENIIIDNDEVEIAIDGIMSLGYSRNEVIKVINKIDTSKMVTEDIIREVLKRISKQ
ncbi:Holliday junction branch migration protein RuvA [Schnuerera ultunensis]|uniref:Holliday junction branch migration complex subunit RuvA n=1 Tax=[Clostridium] ultunense Esp TaxID=1288971 RepID=A0A1M4PN51_9FIRM|nr:Holliday junction branch migration protein RuvA [Schnuerera ultunensis]SHD76884.1 Holliday junction ATP-dependent DNA helicase RuvA [[Clostridium] ultunense Esp]